MEEKTQLLKHWTTSTNSYHYYHIIEKYNFDLVVYVLLVYFIRYCRFKLFILTAHSEVRQTGLSTRGDGGYKTLLDKIYVTQTAFSVTETNEWTDLPPDIRVTLKRVVLSQQVSLCPLRGCSFPRHSAALWPALQRATPPRAIVELFNSKKADKHMLIYNGHLCCDI